MIDLTVETWNETIGTESPVLVDFWATWCGPCAQMAPILEEIDNETIPVYKVDVDKESPIAQEMQVRSMPTLILYEDGVEVDRLIGATTKDKVLEYFGL